jgi:hypothetical protein
MMRRAVTILGVRVGIWDESWTGAAGPGLPAALDVPV